MGKAGDAGGVDVVRRSDRGRACWEDIGGCMSDILNRYTNDHQWGRTEKRDVTLDMIQH